MNAENLMIGDWIITPISEYPIRITGINGQDIVVYNEEDYTEYPYFIAETKPVPLTPEILENNGFTSVEDPYNHKKYFLLGKNEYNCDVYWDGLAILLVEADYEPTTYAYICGAEYVHELQHALKLCKIEKEIVL